MEGISVKVVNKFLQCAVRSTTLTDTELLESSVDYLVEFLWKDGNLTCTVDNREIGSARILDSVPCGSEFWIGQEQTTQHSFSGTMAEVYLWIPSSSNTPISIDKARSQVDNQIF